ncbi:MAG: transglutaminase family protein [Bacteroidota bacterium]
MEHLYKIVYSAKNCYEEDVKEAIWQFLILPMENESQNLVRWSFENSLYTPYHISSNGLGFTTIRLHPKRSFTKIEFRFECELIKTEQNPFDFIPNSNPEADYEIIDSLSFKTNNEIYLRKTDLSSLPKDHKSIFSFDRAQSPFQNLLDLNDWVYHHLYFKTGVTDVTTPLKDIIDQRQGVCQDFAHLFCAIAKENGIPSRYISGYIHQGSNFFGDLQMHAWAEVLLPDVGWIGFDPTNNILVAQNHVKVCHGKDYKDCAPLRGVVFTKGANTTEYLVKVQSSQLQQ